MKSQTANGIEAGAVFFIANHRMPQVLHVNANLVFSPCFEVDFQERKLLIGLDGFVVRYGFLSLIGVLTGVHNQRFTLIQIRNNRPRRLCQNTAYHRQIRSFLGRGSPRFLKHFLYFFTFGKHHYS